MQFLNSEERAQELAEKWLKGTITIEEKQEFLSWYNVGQDDEVHLSIDFAKDDEELKKRIFSAIEKKISDNNKLGSNISFWWYSAAAVLLFFSSVLIYNSFTPQLRQFAENQGQIFIPKNKLNNKPPLNKQFSSEEKVDIPAGRNKAVLTLVDGTKIYIDDSQEGILANQGESTIVKSSEGEIFYTQMEENPPIENDEGGKEAFNVIETPRGGKIQVTLPDGSKVWLNANSSLRIPLGFKENIRSVELKGEAYFEVAHDPARSFEITALNKKFQVLGTTFNINAYPNEPYVNTTLLEGTLKISDLRTHKSQLLKPGERAKFKEEIEVESVNVDHAVAWKDGYFKFHDADIQTIMRQIERWYDVSVRYEGPIPTQRFGGEIERSLSLFQMLTILEKTHVQFRLEGKEVIVLPY